MTARSVRPLWGSDRPHSLVVGTGHAFKHGPVVGRLLADLVLDGERQTYALERFATDRFDVAPWAAHDGLAAREGCPSPPGYPSTDSRLSSTNRSRSRSMSASTGGRSYSSMRALTRSWARSKASFAPSPSQLS